MLKCEVVFDQGGLSRGGLLYVDKLSISCAV